MTIVQLQKSSVAPHEQPTQHLKSPNQPDYKPDHNLGYKLENKLDNNQSHKLPKRHLLLGEKVYKTGQDAELLYMVNQGFVKTVVHSAMGKDRIVDIYGPGDIIGSATLEASLEDSMHSETGQAIGSCTLTPIDPEYALRNVAFSKYLSTTLAKQIVRHRESLQDAALPVGARLCKLLLRFSKRFGKPTSPQHIHLPFSLTQEEFAALTGSSRITISRIFAHLRSTGAIVGKRGDVVLNTEELELAIDTYVLEVI